MAYTKDIEPTIQPGSLKAKVENGRKSNEPKEDKYEQALHKYNCLRTTTRRSRNSFSAAWNSPVSTPPTQTKVFWP